MKRNRVCLTRYFRSGYINQSINHLDYGRYVKQNITFWFSLYGCKGKQTQLLLRVKRIPRKQLKMSLFTHHIQKNRPLCSKKDMWHQLSKFFTKQTNKRDGIQFTNSTKIIKLISYEMKRQQWECQTIRLPQYISTDKIAITKRTEIHHHKSNPYVQKENCWSNNRNEGISTFTTRTDILLVLVELVHSEWGQIAREADPTNYKGCKTYQEILIKSFKWREANQTY